MAYPSDVTYYRGVKDTADNVSQNKPLDIGDKIWMHDPNRNKGLGWVLRNGNTRPCYNHIFGHLEDAPFANWVEHAGANESSQHATVVTLKTGHGVRVTLGSRIYWPRSQEIIRIDAVMNTDATTALSRNYGRGVAATSLLRTGDKGLIIAPAFEQGFTTGAGLANKQVYKTFATSEVSWPVQVTYVEDAEKARGGKPFTVALKKSWKASKDQMEGELFFGGKKVNDSFSPHPISSSEGLDNWISTHVYSATSISRMDLWDILAEWTGTNKNGGVIFCSSAFKAMVTMWSMGQMTMDQDAKKDGMEINQILTPFGTFDLVEIDLLSQEQYLMGTVFFVPRGQIDYRPLVFGEDLDIKYNPISRDEVHSNEGEIYGVYGWEFHEEEMFAKLDGLRFAA